MCVRRNMLVFVIRLRRAPSGLPVPCHSKVYTDVCPTTTAFKFNLNSDVWIEMNLQLRWEFGLEVLNPLMSLEYCFKFSNALFVHAYVWSMDLLTASACVDLYGIPIFLGHFRVGQSLISRIGILRLFVCQVQSAVWKEIWTFDQSYSPFYLFFVISSEW